MFNSNKIAIDLGTANTVVYKTGEGVVLSEPSIVVVDKSRRKIIAMGREAKQMLGKEHGGIEVIRPMRFGTISHYYAAEALLKRILEQVLGKLTFTRPEILASVPAGATSVERRAVLRALQSAGAGKIRFVEEPIAAAIGAGLPVHSAQGNLVINLGGGTAEIAVMAVNGIVAVQSIKGCGELLTEKVVERLRQKNNLSIGLQIAEEIKHTVCSLSEPFSVTHVVKGQDKGSGQPREVTVSGSDFQEVSLEVIKPIIGAIQDVISHTPPELIADLVEQGAALAGGTSMLKGLDVFLTKVLSVPVYRVEEPLYCVSRGLARVMEHEDDYGYLFK